MQDTAFLPLGNTFLITGGPVQVVVAANVQAPTSYRVRNDTTTVAYFAWNPPLPSGLAPSITAVAPTALAVAVNTIGMVASSVEVFRLPAAAWFQASTGSTFEVTPGEGV